MTPEQWRTLEDLFDAARALPATQWDAFARQHAPDPVLRDELLSLLRAEQSGGHLLDHPIASVAPLIDPAADAADPLIGHRLGAYTITAVIGRGGMGVVYEARQDSPQRTVALKVIRPGAITPGLLRRFQHEAEVLGRLQHPGIAQVYESGSAQTPLGRQPFFALELIRGTPLLHYAESRRLSTRDRLALFALVCDAVQHAHLKGVVHRDLKPANILVDESGQPKVLDFGIARLTDSDIRITTIQTDVGQLIGTVPYMSPEQAAGDAARLDARSDVYALGVILFELLSGRLPYDLRGKPVPEAVRVISDQDPTRLSIISRTFRGDLETINAKALEKDRDRRYQSAADLAADLRRYLADQAILARPPSATYQLRKFARRNKALVGGVAAAFLLLIAGIIGTSVGLLRAVESERLAREETRRARIEAAKSRSAVQFLQNMLGSADPESGAAAALTVRDVLDEARATVDSELADEPEVRASIHYTLGSAYLGISDTEAARRHLAQSLDLRTSISGRAGIGVANALHSLAILRFNAGERDAAIADMREALAIARADPDAPQDTVVYHLCDLAGSLQKTGATDEALAIARQAADLAESALGPSHAATAHALHLLAQTLEVSGKFADAEAADLRAVAIARERFGPRSARVATYLIGLSSIVLNAGRDAQALPLAEEALSIRTEVFGPDHPRTATAHTQLAGVQLRLRALPEAEGNSRRAMEIRAAHFGPDHSETALAQTSLAQILTRRGGSKLDEAETLIRAAIVTRRSVLGPDHRLLAQSIEALGDLLYRRKKYDDARAALPEAVAIRRKSQGDRHPFVSNGLRTLGACAAAQNDHAAAAAFYGESESILSESLKPDHPILCGVREYTARSLAVVGELDRAEALYRAALEGRRARGPSPELANTLDALAELLRRRGPSAEADALAAESTALRASAAPPAGP